MMNLYLDDPSIITERLYSGYQATTEGQQQKALDTVHDFDKRFTESGDQPKGQSRGKKDVGKGKRTAKK
jgi:hypothetical protein